MASPARAGAELLRSALEPRRILPAALLSAAQLTPLLQSALSPTFRRWRTSSRGLSTLSQKR